MVEATTHGLQKRNAGPEQLIGNPTSSRNGQARFDAVGMPGPDHIQPFRADEEEDQTLDLFGMTTIYFKFV